MANPQSFFERLRKAPKSFAVLGLVLTGTSNFWWPLLNSAVNGDFGPDVQKWAVLTLSIISVLGWAVPQRSISGDPDSKR